MKRIARWYLDEFFDKFHLPVPEAKVLRRLNCRWVGRCVAPRDTENTQIQINAYFIGDARELDRTVAHEVIHHWQFVSADLHARCAAGRVLRCDLAHGEDFLRWAAKINAVKGADYVTVTSDSTIPPVVGGFYVLIKELTGDRRYGWAWMKRPSPKQRAAVARYLEEGFKLVRADEYKLLLGTRVTFYVAYSTSRMLDPILADLWANAPLVHGELGENPRGVRGNVELTRDGRILTAKDKQDTKKYAAALAWDIVTGYWQNVRQNIEDSDEYEDWSDREAALNEAMKNGVDPCEDMIGDWLRGEGIDLHDPRWDDLEREIKKLIPKYLKEL